MGQMSFNIWVFTCIPEHIFLLLIVAFLLGKKELLCFRNKTNIIRFLSAVLINSAATYLIKLMPLNYAISAIFQVAIFTIVYALILNFKWYKASIATMVSIMFYSILELIDFKIINAVTGITLDECYANDVTRILVFAPMHSLMVVAAVFLYFKPGALDSGNIKKLNMLLKKKFTLINTCIFSAMTTVVFTVKIFVFDYQKNTIKEMIVTWVNILIILILCIVIYTTSNKFLTSIKEERENNIINLSWVRSMLDDNSNDLNKVKKALNDEISKYRTGG